MDNKMKVLVMYATDYSIKDEATGRTNEGCTLQYYYYGERGELLEAVPSGQRLEGAVGYQRAKCSADIALRKKITSLPGIFDATLSMTVGSDGKAVMKITDLDNYFPVDFSKLIMPTAKPAAKEAAPAATK